MLIKDVYKRIEDLEDDRRNFMKIQEFCLGHTVKDGDTAHIKVYKDFEEAASLSNTMRNLASKTVRNIDSEIARLKSIIENAHVKID